MGAHYAERACMGRTLVPRDLGCNDCLLQISHYDLYTVQRYPEMGDSSLSQDTMHGPSYVMKVKLDSQYDARLLRCVALRYVRACEA